MAINDIDKIIDTGSNKEYLTEPWSANQKFMSGVVIPRTGAELLLYDYNRGPSSTIKIDILPDTISEAYSPRVVKKSPFGIAHPLNFYVGGSEKTLSMSIDVHEDVDALKGSTLYEFVSRLKNMSLSSQGKTSSGDDYIKPPEVYFQLGDQFAGRGHITTSFEYKKPFSNGRYKVVTISITFVFHELFDSRSLNMMTIEGSNIISEEYKNSLTVGGSELQSRGIDIPISDLYDQVFGDEYYITQFNFVEERLKDLFRVSWSTDVNYQDIFDSTDGYPFMAGAEKLNPNTQPNKFYESVVDWYLEARGEDDIQAYQEVTKAINYDSTSLQSDNIHPYIVRMMEVLRRYYYILQLSENMSYRDTVNNLTIVRDELALVIDDYLNPMAAYFDTQYYSDTGQEVGIYVDPSEGIIAMNRSEISAFNEIIGRGDIVPNLPEQPRIEDGGLLKQIDNYIYLYTIMVGAGG